MKNAGLLLILLFRLLLEKYMFLLVGTNSPLQPDARRAGKTSPHTIDAMTQKKKMWKTHRAALHNSSVLPASHSSDNRIRIELQCHASNFRHATQQTPGHPAQACEQGSSLGHDRI